jgi:hypothetical protein
MYMNHETYPSRRGNLESRFYQSTADRAIAEHGPVLEALLDTSSLSYADKQQLRKLSADYVMATTSYPEEETAARREILENLSADVPLYGFEGEYGLRRTLSKHYAPIMLVDGTPITADEFNVLYTVIEPSTEVLDLVTNVDPLESATEPVAQMIELPDETLVDMDVDAMEELAFYEQMQPALEQPHRPLDEFLPITGPLLKLGSKVVQLVGFGSHSHS